jgi:hypothetical protein
MSYLTTLRVPPEYQDAFGRLRTSEPGTTFDADFLTSSRPDLWAQLTSGAGAVAYTINFPHVALTTGGIGRAVRQSREYLPYLPGKSFLSFVTGVLAVGGGAAGVTARIGLFDDGADKTVNPTPGNGFFFQLVGTALSVVLRSGITGVQVDTVVPQAAWNIDPLNGTGRSGVTLVPGNRQIFMFEMEWLGVGEITFGVVIDRALIPCHRMNFANQVGISAYTNRGSLPVRYEVSSTGPAAEARQICCTVISEGGRILSSPLSRAFAADRGNTLAVVTNTVERPLLAVRLKATRNRASLGPLGVNAMTTTSDFILIALYRFISPEAFGAGPLTGPVWTAVNALTVPGFTDMSVAESDITASAVDLSGAVYPFVRVASFYFSTSANQGASSLIDISQTLSADIQGRSDWYVITARRALTSGGSESLYAGVQWIEYE